MGKLWMLSASCLLQLHLYWKWVLVGRAECASMYQGRPGFLLQDQRLHFQLKKQQFVELTQLKTAEGDKEALECAKTELVPLALHAYPEAYLELKHLLKLLLCDAPSERQESQPSTCEREKLAGLVYQTLARLWGLRPPLLVLQLCYLLHINNVYGATTQQQLPHNHLAEHLLLPQRDPAPLPELEPSGPHPFQDKDLVYLKGHLGITREEAVEALKAAKGDTGQACVYELMRMRLLTPRLRELVDEYETDRHCSEDDGALPQVSASCTQGVDGCEGRWRQMHERGHTNECNDSGSPPKGVYMVTDQDVGGQRQEAEVIARLPTCHHGRSKSQSPPCKVARPNEDQLRGEDCVAESHGPGPGAVHFKHSQPSTTLPHNKVILRRFQQLARHRKLQAVIDLVNDVDPDIFKDRRDLLFDLKRCRYLELRETDMIAALEFVRTDLTPLVQEDPALAAGLKSLLPTLISASVPSCPPVTSCPQQTLDTLHMLLQSRLGVRQPGLVDLMGGLLGAHRAWFALQRCPDPFEGVLELEQLRAGPGVGKAEGGKQTGVSLPSCLADRLVEVLVDEREDRQAPVEESSILMLMDVLELPRSMAIDLLVEHQGNVEAVIEQLL